MTRLPWRESTTPGQSSQSRWGRFLLIYHHSSFIPDSSSSSLTSHLSSLIMIPQQEKQQKKSNSSAAALETRLQTAYTNFTERAPATLKPLEVPIDLGSLAEWVTLLNTPTEAGLPLSSRRTEQTRTKFDNAMDLTPCRVRVFQVHLASTKSKSCNYTMIQLLTVNSGLMIKR